MRAAVCGLAVFFLAVQGRAATSTTQLDLSNSPQAKKLSATILVDTTTTLNTQASESPGEGYNQSGLYRADLRYSLPNSMAVSARVQYSQEYSYYRDDGTSGGLEDSRLGVSKSFGEIKEGLSLATGAYIYLPTSTRSQKAGLKGGVGIAAPLKYTFRKFDFGLTPSVVNNYHEYEIADGGRFNMQYVFTAMLFASYNFSEKLAATISYAPTRGYTYRGTSRDTFLLAYDLSYVWTDKVSTSVGLATNASTIKSSGRESNYTFYDQNQSVGYFDIVISL
jgi:hypothetical protein